MHPSSGTTGGWGANTKDWGRVKQSWQEQERARQRLELIGVDEWQRVLPYHLCGFILDHEAKKKKNRIY